MKLRSRILVVWALCWAGAVVGRPAEMSSVELKGVVSSGEGVVLGLVSARGSTWLAVGSEWRGVRAISYDPMTGTATLSVDGEIIEAKLPGARIAVVAAVAAGAPEHVIGAAQPPADVRVLGPLGSAVGPALQLADAPESVRESRRRRIEQRQREVFGDRPVVVEGEKIAGEVVNQASGSGSVPIRDPRLRDL